MASSKSSTSSAWRRWTKRILISLGVLIFVFIFVVVPVFFSWALTHARSRPSDREMVKTPENYGVQFHSVKFEAIDGTELSGWWLPAEDSPVVIIYGHGLFRSRLEVLERAAQLQQKGYSGFLLDFRRHGESSGEMTSVGYLERLDVLGAVKYIRETLQIKKPVVTLAVSMGTAASMLAAAESQEIAGLILDSSFLSFKHTITHHAKLLLGLPKFPLADEIILFSKWWVGFDHEDFDMRIAIDKIGDRPILFIAGEDDDRMPPEISQELYDRSTSARKKIVVFPQTGHGRAFRVDGDGYLNEIISFIETNFNQPSDSTQLQSNSHSSNY